MTIAVIGCGAWATTISEVLAENKYLVKMWCHDSGVSEKINHEHINPLLSQEKKLSVSIVASCHLEKVLCDVDAIVIGVASTYLQIVDQIKPFYSSKTPVLILTKGFMQHQPEIFVLDYVKKSLNSQKVAILSGPNLAGEIFDGLPAATVVASSDEGVNQFFQEILNNQRFRIYTSSDDKGVLLGGVLKNIIAISSGIVDGLSLGYNAKAALMTRGLQEMVRFGIAFGAKKETFFGLSGVGDLIATCSSPNSRNYRIGFALASSQNLEEAISSLGGAVAEGVKTTQIVYELAKKKQVDMPLTQEMYQVLYENKSIRAAISSLMDRKLKVESE